MKSKESLKDMLQDYASKNPEIAIQIITPCEQYIKEFMEWFQPDEKKSPYSKVGSADGPTSVFILEKMPQL